MLTDQTRAVFARDLHAPPHWNAEQADAYLARARDRHVAYERHFDAARVSLEALPAPERDAACRRLRRLDTAGCLSGSLEFRQTVESLAQLGVEGANALFHHDRQWLAGLALTAAAAA